MTDIINKIKQEAKTRSPGNLKDEDANKLKNIGKIVIIVIKLSDINITEPPREGSGTGIIILSHSR
jgi:hypothetical protein